MLNHLYHHLLHQINQLISVEKLLSLKNDSKEVLKYYQTHTKFYQYFHSKEGAMHFPLYLENQYGEKGAHPKALFAQPQMISQYVQKMKAQNVLEIGCGLGYNLHYLAQNHRNVQFTGIDLRPKHTYKAQKKAQNLVNLEFQTMDFNVLQFPAESFDLIFAVESFCYAQDVTKVLAQMYQILKPNGLCLIFDMFQQKQYTQNVDLQKIIQLTAKGFAVDNWQEIADFLEKIGKVGFEMMEKQDVTQRILPNVLTFQKSAQKMLQYTSLVKTLHFLGIIPSKMIAHNITGFLTPYCIESQGIAYYFLAFQKVL
jgi:arsenite methyltransferase